MEISIQKYKGGIRKRLKQLPLQLALLCGS